MSGNSYQFISSNSLSESNAALCRHPQQSKANLTLTLAAESKPDGSPEPEVVETLPLSQIRCEAQIGGLLKHYYRQAA